MEMNIRKLNKRVNLMLAFIVALVLCFSTLSNSPIALAGPVFGDLTICKVAGTGVTPGTNFSFTVNGSIPVTVAAGACVTLGTTFTQGTNVTVQETVPSGMQVSAISVSQSAVLVSANLSTGTAVVTIGVVGDFSHNTVTFTNQVIPPVVTGCTLTQGFWKNHPAAWPVGTLTLGTKTYTKAQLLAILGQPVAGNGLIALAHQLIAAKLNIANGASAPASVLTAIAQADALIDGKVVPPIGSGFLAPSVTSALTDILDQYNSGLAAGGPPHCD
jgi:hypothetical protein